MPTVLRRWLTALVVPILFLAGWEIAFVIDWLPQSQSAAPTDILATLVALVKEGALVPRTIASVKRLCIGVAVGGLAGTAVGMVTARLPSLERVFNPTLQFLAPIPVVIWIPFAIMLLGVGELYQIAMVGLSAFFLLEMYAFAGVKDIRAHYRQLSEMYEHSFLSRIRHVLLPGIAPHLLGGLRLALIIAWIVLFMVEFGSNVPAETGLGYLIRQERGVGRIEDAFAGVLVLAGVAFLLDLVVVKLQRWTNRWRREYDDRPL